MPRVMGNNSPESGAPRDGAAQDGSQLRESRRAGALAAALLVVLSVAFRLPALANAAGVHSDAAIVGIQATHMLHGEWSPLLFGSGYQTSVDSAIAALFFAPAGPGPLALMLSTLTGHVLLTLFVFATLRRHVGAARAFVLSLVLVFTPPSVHTYVLHPPRQASLTLAFASYWAIDRAAGARASARTALGGALAALACFADPYALVLVPSVAAFALLTARGATFEPARMARRVGRGEAARNQAALPSLVKEAPHHEECRHDIA